MSVSNIGSSTNVGTNYHTTAAKTSDSKATENVKNAENASTAAQTVEGGAVYEKSEKEEMKVTYSIHKMSSEERASLVEKLMQDHENRKSQLSNLVRDMLSKQGEVSNLADLFSPENLKKVSAQDIAQAKEDVSEDGYWGVKQTSQRLFDFASALAGDDVEKMKEMQEAMKKGFEKATAAWGKDLPQICSDTLDAANQLFADYFSSKETA